MAKLHLSLDLEAHAEDLARFTADFEHWLARRLEMRRYPGGLHRPDTSSVIEPMSAGSSPLITRLTRPVAVEAPRFPLAKAVSNPQVHRAFSPFGLTHLSHFAPFTEDELLSLRLISPSRLNPVKGALTKAGLSLRDDRVTILESNWVDIPAGMWPLLALSSSNWLWWVPGRPPGWLRPWVDRPLGEIANLSTTTIQAVIDEIYTSDAAKSLPDRMFADASLPQLVQNVRALFDLS